MAKFCVYCGAPLEETSGQCPLCEREQPNLSEPKPMVWPKVEAVKPPDEPEQESFAHAQEWLSQESAVWQEDLQDGQVPEPEKPQEETQESLQSAKPQEQQEEPQAKAHESAASVEGGEKKEYEGKAPETLYSESGKEKQEEKDVIQQNDFSTENDESRQAGEEEKTPGEHQEVQQTESDEARQIEYENTFSEMLQDFSEEQKEDAVPPQPKYLPAATYEERPEPTTAGILGTLVLSMIPIVGWVLLLVWAFDGQAAVFQKRLARALLLFKLILWLILLIAGGLTLYISYEIIRMSAYSAFAFSGMA